MGQVRDDVSDRHRTDDVGLPIEDLAYLLIILSGVATLVLELPWWILVVWLVISTTTMIRIETNSREIRRED